MLSTPAFNALLKILEEPPEHLIFILATTELHKVLATIRSRCQQFSFKRILPGDIAARLAYVAGQEHLDLTAEGAALLARLADGGLRDALSLLDQCAGAEGTIDEARVLDTLGLAGNLETARLMERIADGDAAAALETLGRLYAAGKDVGSVLGELSGLIRDLLLRRTAPGGAAALLTGGFDETTMRALGERFTAPRLMQMLALLQQATADLSRSSNRRTDAELCLIRLCDVTLDDSLPGLSARLTRLEQLMNGSAPAPNAVSKPTPRPAPAPAADDLPPWEEERPPASAQPEEHPTPQPPVIRAPVPEKEPPVAVPTEPAGDFWPSFCAGLKSLVPPSASPYLTNPAAVSGTWQDGVLTLWVADDFTKAMLNRPNITEPIARAAGARFGQSARLVFSVGKPPVQTPAPAPAPAPAEDALDQLLDFGSKFDNIVIE